MKVKQVRPFLNKDQKFYFQIEGTHWHQIGMKLEMLGIKCYRIKSKGKQQSQGKLISTQHAYHNHHYKDQTVSLEKTGKCV